MRWTKILLVAITFTTLLGCKQSIQKNQPVTGPTDSIHTVSDTITLVFAGDIMQHTAQLQAAKTDSTYDYSSYFKLIEHELKSADMAIANLETPMGAPPYKGYPQFSAPPELAQTCKDAGFNLLLTANNHSVDRYGWGIERTIQILDSLRIDHLGTYLNKQERTEQHPHFKSIKGKTFAFLNYTYGTNGIKIPTPYVVNLIDTLQIKADLTQARVNKADVIIVCIHWGDEYHTSPNQQQKQLAKWLIEHGADHIIGSHPHVIQPIIQHTDSFRQTTHTIAYSLGNLISNMSQKDTDGGLLLKMKFYEYANKLQSETSYSLVWTGRPVDTGKKNFILFPSNFALDSLNTKSRNKLILFKQRANTVLEQNSKEINNSN